MNKKSAVKQAIQLASNSQFAGDFDLIVMSAEDFLAGKKIAKRNHPTPDVKPIDKKLCKVQ